MERNVESRFAQNAVNVDITRSTFDRGNRQLLSFNVGDLVPFYVDPVYPGDTFKVKTSKVVRMQTPMYPVMDNLYLDTYWFFVPSRLVWSHFQNFMGEHDNPWYPTVEYTVPQLVVGSTAVAMNTIADYMGLPLTTNYSVDVLPIRSYLKIWNDWFRDENLQYAMNISTADSNTNYSASSAASGGYCLKAAKYHDYFSACLPSPQRGPSVNLGITNSALTVNDSSGYFNMPVYTSLSTHDRKYTGNVSYGLHGGLKTSANDGANIGNLVTASTSTGTQNANFSIGTVTPQAAANAFVPDNLWAVIDSTGLNNQIGVDLTAISINDLRMAFQMQKFYERSARGGSRYIETLKSHFGVTSPDARLQRAEYLGGNRIPIHYMQVETNASSSGQPPVGSLGAYSCTVDSHDDFIKSFVEHGYLIGLCVARYPHTFSQGAERFWFRKGFWDYYWPEMANIGEMAVYNREIYIDGLADNNGSTKNGVFGYQEAWADMRYKPNRCSSELRPGVSGSLAAWHFADYYTTTPSLSDSWIQEDKAMVDRTLTVDSSTANQLFADIAVSNECTRAMPLYSIPGLIDHH